MLTIFSSTIETGHGLVEKPPNAVAPDPDSGEADGAT